MAIAACAALCGFADNVYSIWRTNLSDAFIADPAERLRKIPIVTVPTNAATAVRAAAEHFARYQPGLVVSETNTLVEACTTNVPGVGVLTGGYVVTVRSNPRRALWLLHGIAYALCELVERGQCAGEKYMSLEYANEYIGKPTLTPGLGVGFATTGMPDYASRTNGALAVIQVVPERGN